MTIIDCFLKSFKNQAKRGWKTPPPPLRNHELIFKASLKEMGQFLKEMGQILKEMGQILRKAAQMGHSKLGRGPV